MRIVVGSRPTDPQRFRGEARYEAQILWDEWHAYVAKIQRLALDARTSGLVLYRNVDFQSSQFGQQGILSYGPERTYQTVEACAAGWLNDLPSQRQYPQCYTICDDKATLVDVYELLVEPDPGPVAVKSKTETPYQKNKRAKTYAKWHDYHVRGSLIYRGVQTEPVAWGWREFYGLFRTEIEDWEALGGAKRESKAIGVALARD
jgi:hypothetical protein